MSVAGTWAALAVWGVVSAALLVNVWLDEHSAYHAKTKGRRHG